jgi:hypothetical protein
MIPDPDDFDDGWLTGDPDDDGWLTGDPDDDDVCPHGCGFDEYCEECDELLEDEA